MIQIVVRNHFNNYPLKRKISLIELMIKRLYKEKKFGLNEKYMTEGA